MTRRDSEYLIASAKKRSSKYEIEQLRNKNIEDLKRECRTQFSSTHAGFVSFVISCKYYINKISVIKHDSPIETFIVGIVFVAFVITVMWVIIHAAKVGKKTHLVTLAVCFLFSAVVFAQNACENCKESDTFGRVILWGIPTLLFVPSLGIFVYLYYAVKQRDMKQRDRHFLSLSMTPHWIV